MGRKPMPVLSIAIIHLPDGLFVWLAEETDQWEYVSF